MGIGALAAHLVQTPTFAVALVSELLDELAGIEVCAPRALIVNIAVISELRTSLIVSLGECAVGRILQQDAQ